jgi:RNA 2',3'-cyclic 3'-phosphodiesterase
MRLFVGIPLTDAAERELAAVVGRLRSGESVASSGGLRWTALKSWHITLQFLGSATEEQLECLMARLSEVWSPPVQVQLGELGCFDRAGVFFADVVVTPELAALQRSVTAATSRCGFQAEARAFHPHITLAREKGHGRGAELRTLRSKILSQPAFRRFTAREFVLYESHLEPGGARYEARMGVALCDA